MAKEHNQMTIVRCCDKSKKKGVKIGSVLALGQACVPGAMVFDFDAMSDFKALYRLSVWAHAYSPINGLDAEIVTAYKQKKLATVPSCHFGINLDITGTERVHKGEQTLITRISHKLGQSGFEYRLAIAPTVGAAWALARYAKEPITIHTLGALQRLPVESLRLEKVTVEALCEVGIDSVEKLAAIPRKLIVKRHGTKCLQRLDQAIGEVPESVTSVPMPNHWVSIREFEYAINNHEKIVVATMELLEDLVKRLSDAGRRGKYFILLLQGEDVWGVPYRFQREFSLLIASDNGKHVQSVLFSLVEQISIPGPVYVIGLTTRDTEKICARQNDLEGNSGKTMQTAELINQLAVEVGAANVREVNFTNSYVPEKSFVYVPVQKAMSVGEKSITNSAIQGRPSKLLEVPQLIYTLAVVPDSPPTRIIWNGKDLKVLQATGPERITLPWIDTIEAESNARDYFKVEDETGRWLWIFKDSSTTDWYVHGLWV